MPSITMIRAKSPTSNPAFFNHTSSKGIESSFRLRVDRTELTHLILRMLTSLSVFWGCKAFNTHSVQY